LQKIFDFYEEIRDFGHLIIDLRANGGGAPSWFYTAFVAPNIAQAVTIDGFAFVNYGGYSSPYANPILTYDRSIFPAAGSPIVADWHRRPIAEFLETYDLPELNLADMKRMDYVIYISTTIRPRIMLRFNREPAFPGKIWLLTGPYMGSAAQLAAWVTQDTGFATLVGEVTGGVYGCGRTYVALPYSGMVLTMDLFYSTDRHGRPLEAGTIPDYFNRDGMNALETVLAMIAEGMY